MKNLIKLYEICSPSRNTKIMRGFCIAALKSIEGVEVFVNHGNVYAVKGKADSYPCVVAHIDEVHQKNRNKRIMVCGDMIYGYDARQKDFCGIGADDKNGIWIAIEAMKRLDYCKVALFKDEEIGCVGSDLADMSFFEDCRFVIQCDRRNGSDFITTASCIELCDSSFFDLCDGEEWGFRVTSGLMTDVMTLKEKGLNVACCNLSCGYYNPHSKNEFTLWSELNHTLEFVIHICEKVIDVISHEYKPYFDYRNKGFDFYNWYYDVPMNEKDNSFNENLSLNDEVYNFIISNYEKDWIFDPQASYEEFINESGIELDYDEFEYYYSMWI